MHLPSLFHTGVALKSYPIYRHSESIMFRSMQRFCLWDSTKQGQTDYGFPPPTIVSLDLHCDYKFFLYELTNRHNIKASVSGVEFWAQIMTGCGGLAAQSSLLVWKRKTTQMVNTHTHLESRETVPTLTTEKKGWGRTEEGKAEEPQDQRWWERAEWWKQS